MSITAITNVTVIDGAGQRTEAATVVVDGERITHVGKGPAPAGATVIDGTGCSVMPGLFNCHYHSSYRLVGSTGLPIGMEGSPGFLTLRGAHNCALALNSGFTSVISAGTPHAVDASLKAAMDEGIMRGPRIMAGSRDVSTTAHTQDKYFHWYWAPGQHPGVLVCDGPEEFRKGVRTEIKRGAEYIKVFATPGHSVRGAYDQMEISPDELRAVIDAAHERGVKVRAHIANKKAIMMAVEYGLDAVDHGDGIDDECIALMAERGTFLIPSCFFPFRSQHRRTGYHADVMRSEMLAMLAILPKAHAAGVKIVLGDDYGTLWLEHGEYGKELGFYVDESGISPADAITWATRNGADMMGMAGELGDIRPGMLADLLIVKGDPLVDINLLGDTDNVLVVMKNGEFEKNLMADQPVRVAIPQLVNA